MVEALIGLTRGNTNLITRDIPLLTSVVDSLATREQLNNDSVRDDSVLVLLVEFGRHIYYDKHYLCVRTYTEAVL